MVNLYAKYENPENGTDYDKEEAKELFIVNQYYKVDNVKMGQSHTNISLKGFNGSYNSVMFEFYELINDEFFKYDIYKDPDYNPYLERETYTFTAIDGKKRTFKVGDLVIDHSGGIGKITNICNCSRCKERGFFEPSFINFDIDEDKERISCYDFDQNFKWYYKIGNEVFGEKPKKENILSIIKELEKKSSSLNGYIKEYKKLLNSLYKGN
jgi:hypothetical protein